MLMLIMNQNHPDILKTRLFLAGLYCITRNSSYSQTQVKTLTFQGLSRLDTSLLSWRLKIKIMATDLRIADIRSRST